jgi:hypothetical protein
LARGDLTYQVHRDIVVVSGAAGPTPCWLEGIRPTASKRRHGSEALTSAALRAQRPLEMDDSGKPLNEGLRKPARNLTGQADSASEHPGCSQLQEISVVSAASEQYWLQYFSPSAMAQRQAGWAHVPLGLSDIEFSCRLRSNSTAKPTSEERMAAAGWALLTPRDDTADCKKYCRNRSGWMYTTLGGTLNMVIPH